MKGRIRQKRSDCLDRFEHVIIVSIYDLKILRLCVISDLGVDVCHAVIEQKPKTAAAPRQVHIAGKARVTGVRRQLRDRIGHPLGV